MDGVLADGFLFLSHSVNVTARLSTISILIPYVFFWIITRMYDHAICVFSYVNVLKQHFQQINPLFSREVEYTELYSVMLAWAKHEEFQCVRDFLKDVLPKYVKWGSLSQAMEKSLKANGFGGDITKNSDPETLHFNLRHNNRMRTHLLEFLGVSAVPIRMRCCVKCKRAAHLSLAIKFPAPVMKFPPHYVAPGEFDRPTFGNQPPAQSLLTVNSMMRAFQAQRSLVSHFFLRSCL